MESITKVYPGDQIAAQGKTATVWHIYYQDIAPGAMDVEFIDTDGNYRHWKQYYDGGAVVRFGIPARYFRTDDKSIIAYVRPRRIGKGYTSGVMCINGSARSFGAFATEAAAMDALKRADIVGRPCTWVEM